VLLLIGLAVLICRDLVLATAVSPMAAFIGAGLWGVHMALTQGLLSKLVADTAPVELRGTAFGVFNLVTGLMLLVASATAGALWNSFGAFATFCAGAVFAALAVAGLLLHRPRGVKGYPVNSSQINGSRTCMNILILIQRCSVWHGEAYNAFRLAMTLQKDHPDVQVNVFLMADAVGCAIANQNTLQGYYSIERMLRSVAGRGQDQGLRIMCGSTRHPEPATHRGRR